MHNVNTDALKQNVGLDGEWQLRSVRARTEAEVDVSRALGVTDNATVGRIDWHLEVDADAPREKLEELKRIAAEHCPGVYCVRHPVKLTTHLVA
jgi:uncharacterized OsmC-like protein